MSQEKYLKIDHHPVDISIKMLNFAGKLIQNQGNYSWVPGWLVETLGIEGAALGIMLAQQCVAHLAWQDRNGEVDSIEIAGDRLACFQQDSPGNAAAPCQVGHCPVRQSMIEMCAQPDHNLSCIPIAGKKGFLMVCGEGIAEDSSPVYMVLQAIAHLMAVNLEAGKGAVKAASYFLPSGDMAQMWSEMLAGLSHDLRTPLACIKGYVTTLLREDVTWDTDSQKEFLGIIVEETDHIENFINNLLDSCTFSWKGEIELKKEPVSLPLIVDKVLRDPSYRNKQHRFTVLFPADFPQVEADPVRIEQVLRNLVDNAVKYSMEKTPIVIKGEPAPGEVVVSVADEGIGIGDEHLNQLFEKFFRVTDGNQRHQKGMGLGLPLARQLLISHGGRIWAKSKLNRGTTFYFTLPYGSPNSK